jgi:hypothetical protein
LWVAPAAEVFGDVAEEVGSSAAAIRKVDEWIGRKIPLDILRIEADWDRVGDAASADPPLKPIADPLDVLLDIARSIAILPSAVAYVGPREGVG